MSTGRVIGIDLGTTYSCAAISEGGKASVIQSKLGYATIPSIVTFNDRGEVLIGRLAERRMILEPENTIYGSKRILGRAYSKEAVETFQSQFRYKLVSDSQGFIAAEVFGKTVPLVEISAHILGEIRRATENLLGEKVLRAVITVPAYFNENQRGLVRDAANMAKLDIIRIINEPTAAALAFGGNKKDGERLLIYDLGGGTFDVSIIEVSGPIYTVLGVGGDTFLGGIDIDKRLSDFIIKRLSDNLRREIKLDSVSKERLREAAQNAKHQLSVQKNTIIQINNLVLDDNTPFDLYEKITREELEEITNDLCDLTIRVVKDVLKSAGLTTRDINEVLLVGGQTRMPIINTRLKEMFGFEPSKRVHPDEVVALGAAIAAESTNKIDAPVLRDVLPMSIGLAGPRGMFQPMIGRNTPVPHEATAHITVKPGSSRIRLAVFQGLSENVAANEYLGTLTVDGLEIAKNPVECAIKFVLDAESILTIHASIKELGIDKQIILVTSFTPDDVLQEMNSERIQVKVQRPPVKPGSVRAEDDGSAPLINLDSPIRAPAKGPAPRKKAPNRDLSNKPASTKPVTIQQPGNAGKTPPPAVNYSANQGYRMMQQPTNWFGRVLDWIRGR